MSEKLSKALDDACHEQRNYLSMVDFTQMAIDRARRIIETHRNIAKNVVGSVKFDLKTYIGDLESSEHELKEALSKFKTLNIKDTKRIQQIYELTTPCTNLLNTLNEMRQQLLDLAAEQTQLLDSELNKIESHIRAYMSHIYFENFDRANSVDHCIELLVNCFKFMLNADLEFSKFEMKLDQLQMNGFVDQQFEDNIEKLNRLKELRETLTRLRKQIKFITMKDSLFDEFVRLKEIYNHCRVHSASEMIDLGKVDKFVTQREEFLQVRQSLERISRNLEDEKLDFYNWEELKKTCLNPIEDKFNMIMSNFNRIRDMISNYKSLLMKIEYCVTEAETKLNTSVSEASISEACMSNEFDRLGARLEYLKEIKLHLLNPQFKQDMDALQHIGGKLEKLNLIGFSVEDLCRHKNLQIRYFDIMCRLDQAIKHVEFECSSFKQIVDMSHKLLDQIKQVKEFKTFF